MTSTPQSVEEFDELPPAPPLFAATAASANGTAKLRQYLTRSRRWQSGDRIDGYQLQELLGSGGMGTVFAAIHADSSQRVAVKILDSAFARQHGALRRFRKEGLLLAETNSPYITRLLEVCDKPEHPFIVTELVEGATLGELLKERSRLDEREALQLAAMVAHALADIAELSIIHRDIKPDNILLAKNLDASGEFASEFIAKLTDFGLARHTQQSHSMELTRENSVLGTPLYMSPEQFTDVANLDVRSDIYSLGATLYHMLAGQPPFPGNDIARLAELHRHSPAPDLRASVPNVSDAVSEVVRKCLQKRRDLRYQSAAELLDDLRKVLRGDPISITVHPLIPDCDRRKVLEFRNEWDLTATPEQLWPFVSNTERLNRAIGLPAVRYTTEIINDAVETFAHVRIAGMHMKWREHVFEWIESRRMGILREFETGPLRWFTSIVEFVPTVDGSTKLIHRFQVEPRGWFGRIFAKFKFGIETRRSLSKVYSRIDSVLARTKGKDPLVDAFEEHRPPSAKQKSRLNAAVDRLQVEDVNRAVLLQLSEFIQHTPAQQAGRIRPIQLVEQLQLPFDQVMDVLLRGTLVGLFQLKWDVICPSCRIASQTYDVLKMVSDHEHCEACNVSFEVDLRNHVEVIFRVHPTIRDVDTGKYCIGGPAHSSHVVAQTRVRADENVQLGLALTAGSYLLRGPQLAKQLTFQVVGDSVADRPSEVSERDGENAPTGETTVSHRQDIMHTMEVQRERLLINLATPSDWTQPNISLCSLQQLIDIHNGFDQEMIVRIERSSPRTDALTAAAILALPLFRQLFPEQTFAKSQLATMSRMTLLQTKSPTLQQLRSEFTISAETVYHEHLRQLSDLCSRHNGTWIKIVDQGAVIAFVSPEDAVAVTEQIDSTVRDVDGALGWRVAVAVVTGPTAATMIGGQLDYLGAPVERLRDLLSKATAGEVLIEEIS